MTDMVYGFNMEELLLASLYDPDKLEKMLAEHDVHKPQCCGAVIYFQGRLLTIGDQSAAVRLGEKEQVEKPQARTSLKERLAAKQTEVAQGKNKDAKEQDKTKKTNREEI